MQTSKCDVRRYDLRAAARPPLRPAAFFCAVDPPCDVLRLRVPEPDDLPPRLDAPGEFAILAARCFDMPLSLRASYCFSFLTFAFLLGMATSRSTARLGLQAGVPDFLLDKRKQKRDVRLAAN